MANVKIKRKLTEENDASNKPKKKKLTKDKVKSEKQLHTSTENESGSFEAKPKHFKTNKNATKVKGNRRSNETGHKNRSETTKKKIFKPSKPGLKTKPNWLEFKKKKKELKISRREGSNPQYELNSQAKKLWETCRSHNCPKEKLASLTNQLHTVLKGRYSMVVHSHDMARVVQFLLKRGEQTVQENVCDELLPHLHKVILSKYGCYCVKPLFVYSNTKRRRKLVDALSGHVVKLLNHTIASKWLEYAYNSWATKEQKLRLRQEMYGKMFNLSKGGDVTNLSELIEKDDGTKSAVLSATKSALTKAIQKQHILVSSMLHSVLLDYLTNCSEVDRNEVLESLVESIMQLLTSRDGTIVAMQVVWYGTNKMKKTIIKLLKSHIKEVSQLEHGHLLLITLFDSVDDTVLMKKAILPELLGVAEELAVDEIGRRVLLHLIAHRDKLHFHPVELELLRKGDEIGTSKKDAEMKHKELLVDVINPLVQFVGNNPGNWLTNSSVCMVTLALLKVALDSTEIDVDVLKSAQTSIASYLIDADNLSVIEDTGIHFILKKLILHENSVIVKDASKVPITLSFALVSNLTEDILSEWVKINRACFILVRLLDCEDENISGTLKTKISKGVKNVLKKESTTGAQLLYSKIKKN